ncbi:MAG: thioredoxin 1 [Glaciecola sp.]|jgi:thioredoxin 1
MSDAVVEVRNLAHYEELIAGDVPVLIDHTAGWCAPCQQMAPDLHDFADRHVGRVIVAKVDSDHSSQISVREPSRTLPGLVLHDRGAIRMVVSQRLFAEQLEDIFGGYLDDRDAASEGVGARPLWISRPERTVQVDPEKPLMVLVRGAETFAFPDPSASQVVVPEGQVLDVALVPHPDEPFGPAVLDGIDRSLVDHLTVMFPVDGDLVATIQSFPELRNLTLMRVELTDDEVMQIVDSLPKLASIGLGSSPPSPALAERLASQAPGLVTYGTWATPEVHASRARAGLAPLSSQATRLPDRNLSGALAANRRDGSLSALLTLTLPDGWHAYGPSSSEGIPASIAFADPSIKFAAIPDWPTDERGWLTGEFKLPLDLAGDIEHLDVHVTVQLCNDQMCIPPKTLELRALVRG